MARLHPIFRSCVGSMGVHHIRSTWQNFNNKERRVGAACDSSTITLYAVDSQLCKTERKEQSATERLHCHTQNSARLALLACWNRHLRLPHRNGIQKSHSHLLFVRTLSFSYVTRVNLSASCLTTLSSTEAGVTALNSQDSVSERFVLFPLSSSKILNKSHLNLWSQRERERESQKGQYKSRSKEKTSGGKARGLYIWGGKRASC
jgi:hypothetical protein